MNSLTQMHLAGLGPDQKNDEDLERDVDVK